MSCIVLISVALFCLISSSSRMLLSLFSVLFSTLIPLFLFCVFFHSLLISGVINHRLFGWQCKTAPGAAIHQSHHPPSSQITRKNWHLPLSRVEEEKTETEIGSGQRGGKRGREEERRKERGRQRWWASAGRGGINFLDRQEQLRFTACRKMVRYKERFLKQIDDPTKGSFSLLLPDAADCYVRI